MLACQEEGLEELPAEQAVTVSVFPADSTPLLIIVETKEIGFNLLTTRVELFIRLIGSFNNYFSINTMFDNIDSIYKFSCFLE